MGDSITDWISQMLGNSSATSSLGGVPNTPGMSGLNIGTSSQANGLNGLGNQGMSGLGLGQLALSGVNGLLSGYFGSQSLGLAKDQLATSKDQWNKQWGANQKATNAALSDRQAARVASNPGAYESVDNYMKKYGI